MQYGLTLPPFDELAEPASFVGLCVDAERFGWDGVFVWDHIRRASSGQNVADPWIMLAAAAQQTHTITLGPMVTPLPRRRPHIVAKQAVTLDHLSGGRLVLGAGLGLDGGGRELSGFGEEMDPKARAGMLDESLEIIDALWSGDTVSYEGTHYRVDGVNLLPRPVRRPRIPIWLAGRWPYRRPLERAARWDGLYPIELESVDHLLEMLAVVQASRGTLEGFDVAVHDYPDGDAPAWEAAGATWWLARFDEGTTADDVRAVVSAGPPS